MITDFFQRIFQTVSIVLVVSDVHPFTADVPFAANVALVTPHLNNSVVLHLNFQTAVLRTKDTGGLVNSFHCLFLSRILLFFGFIYNSLIINYASFNESSFLIHSIGRTRQMVSGP